MIAQKSSPVTFLLTDLFESENLLSKFMHLVTIQDCRLYRFLFYRSWLFGNILQDFPTVSNDVGKHKFQSIICFYSLIKTIISYLNLKQSQRSDLSLNHIYLLSYELSRLSSNQFFIVLNNLYIALWVRSFHF